MPSLQDESLLVDYIFNTLESSDVNRVSQRLGSDSDFRRLYRKVLNSLRPVLQARMYEAEVTQIRQECLGLTQKTLSFIRRTIQEQPELQLKNRAAITETAVNSLQETNLQKMKAEETVKTFS